MTPPTTQEEALKMIAPLNPRPSTVLLIDKYIAYERLEEFIKLLLPKQ